MSDNRYLTAREAASELGVNRATLYAYVSRGLVRSEPSTGSRQRLYRADDVKALRDRKSPRGGANEALSNALNFGAPLLSSAITLIGDENLYYRGRDVAELARNASLEHVAAILWLREDQDLFAIAAPVTPVPGAVPVGLPRAVASLAIANEIDLPALNLSGRSVARTGVHILRLLTAAFTGSLPSQAPIADQLAEAWLLDPAGRDLLRAAMILCADHELNASTFTVRCAASTGAAPYAAISAGLAALQGPKHGGLSTKVWALFEELERAESVADGIAARLRRGDDLPGFGLPLYPDRDPRAEALLALLDKATEDRQRFDYIREVAATVYELTDKRPNIDYALTAFARLYGLDMTVPFALFAIGRSVGWVAHAQEQYRNGRLLRPRARYTGEPPNR